MIRYKLTFMRSSSASDIDLDFAGVKTNIVYDDMYLPFYVDTIAAHEIVQARSLLVRLWTGLPGSRRNRSTCPTRRQKHQISRQVWNAYQRLGTNPLLIDSR